MTRGSTASGPKRPDVAATAPTRERAREQAERALADLRDREGATVVRRELRAWLDSEPVEPG